MPKRSPAIYRNRGVYTENASRTSWQEPPVCANCPTLLNALVSTRQTNERVSRSSRDEPILNPHPSRKHWCGPTVTLFRGKRQFIWEISTETRRRRQQLLLTPQTSKRRLHRGTTRAPEAQQALRRQPPQDLWENSWGHHKDLQVGLRMQQQAQKTQRLPLVTNMTRAQHDATCIRRATTATTAEEIT
jgi:hypothetical protein